MRDSGKTAWNPLYSPNRSFASGPNPGVDDPDPLLLAQWRTRSNLGSWGTRIRTGIASIVRPGVLPLDDPPFLSRLRAAS